VLLEELLREFSSSVAAVGELSEKTFAVLVICVPFAAPELTSYAATKRATSPLFKAAMTQVVVPGSPTAGLVQVKAGPEV
jgi:hypothetical protein